jgi:hypothetical protein
MTRLRKLILPSSLNALLLLKANCKVWSDPFAIQKCLDKRKANGIDDEDEDEDNATERQESSYEEDL